MASIAPEYRDLSPDDLEDIYNDACQDFESKPAGDFAKLIFRMKLAKLGFTASVIDEEIRTRAKRMPIEHAL